MVKQYFICRKLTSLLSTDFCSSRQKSSPECHGCNQLEGNATLTYSQSNVDTRIHDTEFDEVVLNDDFEKRCVRLGIALHLGRMFASFNGGYGSQ
jgi:hypothetical protein